MAIAITLKSYLEDQRVDYDVVQHTPSHSALESAHSAHIPGHQLAKAVVLEDAKGYVVSILPANNRLDLEWVNESLGRNLELAREEELPDLFQDCDLGAIPALSNAYGLDVIWDEQLTNASEIYIEAGDHEHLIHMHGDDFCRLIQDQPHNIISAGTDFTRWVSD